MAAQRGKQPERPQPENAEDYKEMYVDSMQIETGLYTAILHFGDLRRDEPALRRISLKVSPHMLKAIALLTAKHVREFEGGTGGPIVLPNQLAHDWGLEEEIK